MTSPGDPKELAQTKADAEELARQRALALDIRDLRLTRRRERELGAARKRARRAADLLHLDEILAHSGVAQIDYVLRPKATDTDEQSAASQPLPTETKAP